MGSCSITRLLGALVLTLATPTASCGARNGAQPGHPESPVEPSAEPAPLPPIGGSFLDDELEPEPAHEDPDAAHGEHAGHAGHAGEEDDAGVAPDAGAGRDAAGHDTKGHHAH